MTSGEFARRLNMLPVTLSKMIEGGRLPFAFSPPEPKSGAKKAGWCRFNEGHIHKMNTMRDLTSLGLTQSGAASLVRRDNGDAERVLQILRGDA